MVTKFGKLYKGLIFESIKAKKPKTNTQKITWLIENMQTLAPRTQNKSSEEITKIAIKIISKGLFDSIYLDHMLRK